MAVKFSRLFIMFNEICFKNSFYYFFAILHPNFCLFSPVLTARIRKKQMEATESAVEKKTLHSK